MTKTFLTASLIALIAAPTFAVADRMVIDDDGWSMAEDRPKGPIIEIDDDAWTIVDAPRAVSSRGGGTPGVCSQLESSAGLTGEDCGVLDRAQIINLLDDN
ncbi:hypothetical protein [Jannaschia donghaensis]|uniref:Uncharacterized protein n=1 Tax=Jannaschia donghaensis TaxID=420998 RepID=A0A0M6YHC3_9RHOB|nr:hypothetical protein [Jannaschia donghaensis]CTQ49324.1 hypothetical protein JDO7802_01337 [Jannaschia donghaensis]